MTLDGKSTKTKTVDLDKNCNFVVDEFFIWNHLRSQKYGWSFDNLRFKFVKRPRMAKRPKSKLQISIRTINL
jgi:hypothetical protein